MADDAPILVASLHDAGALNVEDRLPCCAGPAEAVVIPQIDRKIRIDALQPLYFFCRIVIRPILIGVDPDVYVFR